MDVAKVLGSAQRTHTQKVVGGKRSFARLDRWYTSPRCFPWIKASNSVTIDHYEGFDHHVFSLSLQTVTEETDQPKRHGQRATAVAWAAAWAVAWAVAWAAAAWPAAWAVARAVAWAVA
eukprot:SAG31_NODE_7117_length_1784_cov_3.031454_2_plen_119_part_00